MKIGLDARSLTMPRPRGIGRSLRDAYLRVPLRRPDWEFVLFHQRPPPAAPPGGPRPWDRPNVRLRRIEMPGDRLDAWFQVRLPLAAWAERVDLLHLPASVAPAWCPVPVVVTVHDLIPLRVPGELPPRATRAYRRGVLRAVRRAAHIVTISEATRADLHREFGVPHERMTTILWPPDLRTVEAAGAPLDPARVRALRERYDLGGRWLVSFAGGNRRKNADGVLRGFARVPPELRRDTQVVLIGCEPAAYRARLAAEAGRLGLDGACRIVGFVPDADVPLLLRSSRGLLIPSRYEGFGWPILDAFVCGVPVLTSRVSSMPEVAGDAAEYCDPDEDASIAAGIARLLDPARAAALVERGRARLALFDRERAAEALCAVYERCLAATCRAARRAGSHPERAARPGEVCRR